MQTPQINCPKCGCPSPALLSAKLEPTASATGILTGPLVTRYVFKCPCGLGFTHTSRTAPRAPPEHRKP